MKTIKYWGLWALLALGACSTAALIDQSLLTFRIQTTKNREKSVEISWPKYDFYKSYDVLRSEQPAGIFQPISSGQSANQYIDEGIEPGKVYYYKVRGYNSKGIGSFTSEVEQGFAGGDFIYPPKTVTASLGLYDDKVLLSWDKIEKSASYSIRRSEAGVDAWAIIANNIVWASYEDTTVVLGKVYDYQVIALDKSGYASQPSHTVQGSKKGNSAQFSANAGMYTDYNLLTWKTPPNTAYTVIYRSDNSGTLGAKVAELGKDAESYRDEAAPGSWYYTVRFFNADDYLVLETPSQEGFRLNLTPKPQNARATKGQYINRVQLTWDAVDKALFYSIQRSLDGGSSWTALGNVSSPALAFEDTGLPGEQAKALYRVSATVDGFQGPYSDASEGWAHRAPLNVRSQKVFGNRVELFWDESPDAVEYEILYSTSGASGPFTVAGTSAAAGYTHSYTIGGDEQQLYYVVRAKNSLNIWSRNSYEDHNNSAEAWITKASAPTPLIVNNKTASERALTFSWAGSRAAAKYKVYRAVLTHGAALVSSLSDADYKPVGETPNYSYRDTLSAAPIRRYHYKIVLVDNDGNEYPAVAADSTGSEVAYRLPVDIDEFMLDTDFNIIEAQMRIANFGNNGSSSQPKGRWQGWYDYNAAASGAKSLWKDFSSFETILNSQANHKMTISLSPLGAKQNGDVVVSGLYTGLITYINLVGADGGWSVGGSVKGTYNHPTLGTLTKTYSYTDASFLQSVVLKSESKPSYPAFDAGAGGSLQAGCNSPK